jgi:hypothetical protein
MNAVLVVPTALVPAVADPTKTIKGIRNVIGFRYSDDILQRRFTFLPFRVVDRDDHPFIDIARHETKTLISPNEVHCILQEQLC